ncbi:RloB family protein [Lentisphaerota bacterium ZTH]|nr:RloB domain-containing protein [Lentisphaerota bacterium]WET05704.1 RloB family protein [Lentisphaerota bacterium ZTH]
MRRNFSRKSSLKRYESICFIISEGKKTEVDYFKIIQGKISTVIDIKNKIPKHSAPKYVLQKAIEIKNKGIRKKDAIWILVDKDSWSDQQLDEVFQWCRRESHGFALSNPYFEYWLLLYFENATQVRISDLKTKLSRHLPDYDKSLNKHNRRFNEQCIKQAVKVAKEQDTPKCPKWPVSKGTTVYRLMEELLSS